jgi:hypothetical protein
MGGRGVLVTTDPDFPKALKQGRLVGDSSKLRTATGWEPKTDAFDLARMILPKYTDYTCA